MILRKRNLWRLAAAVTLPASVGVVLSPMAAGDSAGTQVTTTVLATQSTYYWREQVQATNVGGTDVAPPTSVTDPTVPTGDVAVAGPEVNGQTDKEAYLEFDVSAIPAGSTVTSFVVTLPVDPAGQSFTPTGSAPPVVACTPQGAWTGGANGAQPFAGKPTDQCATNAPKFTSKDGGKTYTADIAPIAQGWITGVNTGVAVADDPRNTQSAYQVVFGPPQSISQLTAQITYVAGSTTLSPPGSQETNPVETLPPSSESVPLVPGGLSPSGAASTTPTTTVPGTNRSLRSPALRNTGFASATPPGIFWAAAVLILALLLSASLVLGDEPAEEPAHGRRRLLLAGTRQGRPAISAARPGQER